MRTLEEMAYDDARATVREAEELVLAGGHLTFEQSALLANALGKIRELEGSSWEKSARRERWERRKGASRRDWFGAGHRS